VIRLITGKFENRNVHRLQNPPDIRNLLAQIMRHLRSVRFVRGKALRTEGWLFAFENRGDVVGLKLGRQTAHHVVEDVDSLGGEASTGAHGRSTAAGARVVGPEDK